MPQTLRDIMNAEVISCRANDSMYDAAALMHEHNIGAVPIVSDGELIGMITDRDIAIRGVAQKRPESSQVTEVMSDELTTGTPDMPVEEAARLMARNQIRRLPVVEGNRLVGMVALGDLAVREQFDDEAEEALSEISENRPGSETPPGR